MASENTEVNQINALIDIKKDEIKELEDRRSDEEAKDLRSPAEIAHDPNEDAAARAAAATVTASQDPSAVFAAQSEPSPSTHAEQFESEEKEQQVEAEDDQPAESDNTTPAGDQGVETPKGRGDVNRLGDPETLGYGSNPENEAAQAADAGDKAAQKQEKADADNSNSKADDEDAKEKAAETHQNEGSVASTGKTADDDQKPNTKKGSSKKS